MPSFFIVFMVLQLMLLFIVATSKFRKSAKKYVTKQPFKITFISHLSIKKPPLTSDGSIENILDLNYFFKIPMICSASSVPIRSCASNVAAPICGVNEIFGCIKI